MVALAVRAKPSIKDLYGFSVMALELVRRVVDERVYDTKASEGRFGPCLRAWGDGWHMAIDDFHGVFERVCKRLSVGDGSTRSFSEALGGVSPRVMQTAPFALAMAFRDVAPERTLLETVNIGASGSASVVMSIVGARVGVTGLPKRFLMPEDCPLVTSEHEALGPRVKRFADAVAMRGQK